MKKALLFFALIIGTVQAQNIIRAEVQINPRFIRVEFDTLTEPQAAKLREIGPKVANLRGIYVVDGVAFLHMKDKRWNVTRQLYALKQMTGIADHRGYIADTDRKGGMR